MPLLIIGNKIMKYYVYEKPNNLYCSVPQANLEKEGYRLIKVVKDADEGYYTVKKLVQDRENIGKKEEL